MSGGIDPNLIAEIEATDGARLRNARAAVAHAIVLAMTAAHYEREWNPEKGEKFANYIDGLEEAERILRGQG